MLKIKANPKFIIVDLFCGAGGTSTGFAQANGLAVVAACVNHDKVAIKSHWMNYPQVEHFNEDITKLYGHLVGRIFFMSEQMKRLVRLIDIYRAFYPDAKVVLWASLECTNFSNAKGGQSRDADSRTLANHLDFYVWALDPDYIQIENVVEFMAWGPLRVRSNNKYEKDEPKGQYSKLKIIWNKKKGIEEYSWMPLDKEKGKDWLAWKEKICAYGYRDDWKKLNSADFGAFTSRKRLFGIFAKADLPIVWPSATHAKKPVATDLFTNPLKKWKAVKDVLDFSDEGKSIFNRKKPLSDNTYKRVYEGCIKFVAGGKDNFLVKYNSMSVKGKYVPPSLSEPSPTLTCQGRLAVVKTSFLEKTYSGNPKTMVSSIDEPSGTITTIDHHRLVNPLFISQRNGGKPASRIVSLEVPARTLTATGGNQDLVSANFITKYHGKGFNTSVDNPSPTIATKDQMALVGTYYLMNTNYFNIPSQINQPCPIKTASNKWHYLINPSWGGHQGDIEQPSPVLIARQDKAPLYLMTVVGGIASIPIYDDDTEIVIKLKEFMCLYGIGDIKMRAFRVKEMLNIQWFPSDYVLAGTQNDKKKFIGNSVTPILPKVWTIALAEKLLNDNYANVA